MAKEQDNFIIVPLSRLPIKRTGGDLESYLAAPIAGIHPKENTKGQKVYRIGRVPRTLWTIGDRLLSRFGKLGHEYKKITFDKNILTNDPTLEWVTPGHPLFECVRDDVLARVQEDLRRVVVPSRIFAIRDALGFCHRTHFTGDRVNG